MAIHAFVDESQRRDYLMCATLVGPGDLSTVRSEMRTLLLPGQRRIHFRSESDRRRRLILASVGGLPATFVVARASGPADVARSAAWSLLLCRLAAEDCRRLVVERRGPDQDRAERRFLARRLDPGVEYVHRSPHEEPVLWVSDVVAWSVGAGGPWLDGLPCEVLRA